MYVYKNKKGLTEAARSPPRTTQGTITGETWDLRLLEGCSWNILQLIIHGVWCEFLHPSWCGHSSPLVLQDRLWFPDSQRWVSFTAWHRVRPAITHTSDLWAVCLPLFTGGTSSLGSWFSPGNSHTDSSWAGALNRDHALEGTSRL